jgi:hypothetical protein
MKPQLVLIAALGLLTSCDQPKITVPEKQSIGSKTKLIIANEGDTLHTDFFDVTLLQHEILKGINTGNEYTTIYPDKDSKYLGLKVKYKNTDTESRMLGIGAVYIRYNNKGYTFDHLEQVLSKNWLTGIEQLNPLTSTTKFMAYKLPKEITGAAYYHPGRTDTTMFIYIGEIK